MIKNSQVIIKDNDVYSAIKEGLQLLGVSIEQVDVVDVNRNNEKNDIIVVLRRKFVEERN